MTGAGSLEPRPTVLRTFAVTDDGNNGQGSHGYSVMPGGLTRVGAGPTPLMISSRRKGTSKDTWVASAEPALQQSAWLPAARTRVVLRWRRTSPPRFPAGWPPSCSFWAVPPSTPSWSSASSGPC